MNATEVAETLIDLERVIAAVKDPHAPESKFTRALAALKSLSRKEGIPLAIVGGLAAIHHGYERFTKDIDIVVQSGNLDVLTRGAPHYGIKVIWKDPEGCTSCSAKASPLTSFPRAASLGRTHRPPS